MNKNIVNHAISTLLNFMREQSKCEKNYPPLIGIIIMNNGNISGIWSAEIDDMSAPWYEITEALGHCYKENSIVCIVLQKGFLGDERELDYEEILHSTSQYFLESYGYRIYGYIHDPTSKNPCDEGDAENHVECDCIKLPGALAQTEVDSYAKAEMRYQYFYISSLIEFIFEHGDLPEKSSSTLISQCAKYLEVELVRDALCENLFNLYQDAYYVLLSAIAKIYQGTANTLLSLIAYDKGDFSLAEREALIGFYSFPHRNSFASIVLKIIFSEISQTQVQYSIGLGSIYAQKYLEI